MFCGQLISSDIIARNLNDSVAAVLEKMEELKVSHLPITADEKYLGLIADDDLQDTSPETPLSELTDYFIHSSVQVSDYFLVGVKVAHVMQIDVIPVLNEKKEFEGVIRRESLFRELAQLTGAEEYGSMVVLEMEQKDYSVGNLNRLVESNDAIITQLNTRPEKGTSTITVVLRINKEEISDIVATFQRHDYTVKYYLGEELFRNELQSNLDHLMNYLNI
jgi:acetoin utilization protein AcuB